MYKIKVEKFESWDEYITTISPYIRYNNRVNKRHNGSRAFIPIRNYLHSLSLPQAGSEWKLTIRGDGGIRPKKGGGMRDCKNLFWISCSAMQGTWKDFVEVIWLTSYLKWKTRFRVCPLTKQISVFDNPLAWAQRRSVGCMSVDFCVWQKLTRQFL